MAEQILQEQYMQNQEYLCECWGGSSAMWLSGKPCHRDGTCVVFHRCGFSCGGPSWNDADKCNCTARTGMSSLHLVMKEIIFSLWQYCGLLCNIRGKILGGVTTARNHAPLNPTALPVAGLDSIFTSMPALNVPSPHKPKGYCREPSLHCYYPAINLSWWVWSIPASSAAHTHQPGCKAWTDGSVIPLVLCLLPRLPSLSDTAWEAHLPPEDTWLAVTKFPTPKHNLRKNELFSS